MKKIITQGLQIAVIKKNKEEYISLTDMAKFKDREATGIVIANWLSTKYTIQFMGAWEHVHNPSFNVMEFNNIKTKRDLTDLSYLLQSGYKKQTPLVSDHLRVDTVEPLLIGISPSSLLPGYRRNLNFI